MRTFSNSSTVLNRLAAIPVSRALPRISGRFYIPPGDLWPVAGTEVTISEIVDLYSFATSVASVVKFEKTLSYDFRRLERINVASSVASHVRELVSSPRYGDRNARILFAMLFQLKEIPVTTGGVIRKLAELRGREEVTPERQSVILDLCQSFAREHPAMDFAKAPPLSRPNAILRQVRA